MEVFSLKEVKLIFDEQFATVEITREKKLNALNSDILNQLYRAFSIIEEKKEIRVIVLKGEGNIAFAAGADLEEVTKKASIEEFRNYYAAFDYVFEKIARLKQPVIASVNGYAFGGGCLLALACDLVIASDKSMFSQPEINFGFTGGASLLPRLIGRHKAAEITMLGKPFTAEEGLKLNLINKVVIEEELQNEVMKLCQTLANKDPIAMAMTKSCIRNTFETSLSSANKYETEVSTICLNRAESKDLIENFINKKSSK